MTRTNQIIIGSIISSVFLSLSVAQAQTVPVNITGNSITGNTTPVEIFPHQQSFIITAYYSPIPNQKHYIRGSYEADKKLNGNGVHGADGTNVYPGMIAAPKDIPFGTKMKLPGIGTVAVHDRGGAIVNAGARGQQYDRLDLWMGQGDEGLNRALHWGRRTVEATVYGIDSSVVENIDLSGVSTQDFPDNNPTATQLIHNNFGLGDSDPEIAQIKQKFTNINYFHGALDQNFDQTLYNSVLKFQLDYLIVDNADEFGAGYFGPQTRVTLEKATQGLAAPIASKPPSLLPIALADSGTDAYQKQVQLAGNGLSFLNQNLKLGDSGQAVIELQTELAKLNLFGVDPSGYYGDITAHAVFKFQQSQGLVADLNSLGASVFDTVTRQKLAILVSARIQTRQIIADNSLKSGLVASK